MKSEEKKGDAWRRMVAWTRKSVSSARKMISPSSYSMLSDVVGDFDGTLSLRAVLELYGSDH